MEPPFRSHGIAMADTDETTLTFDPSMPPAGRLDRVAPLIRRRVAPNGGPFTASGTCTYVVGQERVAVIDPGPDDPAHVDALLQDLGTERVEAIVVTHTHRDHSPGARLPCRSRATGSTATSGGRCTARSRRPTARCARRPGTRSSRVRAPATRADTAAAGRTHGIEPRGRACTDRAKHLLFRTWQGVFRVRVEA